MRAPTPPSCPKRTSGSGCSSRRNIAPRGGEDSRSSIVSQCFKHDGDVPKSFATWAREEFELL